MRAFRLTLVFAGGLLLAACATDAPPPLTLDWQPATKIPVRGPAVDVAFAPGAVTVAPIGGLREGDASVPDIVESWADRRLTPIGGNAQFQVTVLEARLEEESLQTTDGLAGLVRLEETGRVIAVLSVRLDYRDIEGTSMAEATVRSSATIPEYATEERRRAIIDRLMEDLARSFDTEMVRQMRAHMPPRAFRAG